MITHSRGSFRHLMFGELYTIHMANNTKMGQNSTSQIPVKRKHGYSPKYTEHVFSVVGLSLRHHGFDKKLRQITNFDGRNSWFVAICDQSRDGASRPRTRPRTLKPCFVYLGEYPCALLTWIWKIAFCPFWCYCSGVSVCVCSSFMTPINDVPRVLPWNGPISMWTCFLYLGVYHRALLTVVFWTVTNCDSHKLRQTRNPCRRNLWFVAICDQDRAWQIQSDNIENMFWLLGGVPMFTFDNWEVEFWPIFILFSICIAYNSPNMRCRNEPMECV